MKIITDGIEQKERLIYNNNIYSHTNNITDGYGIETEDKISIYAKDIYFNIIEEIQTKYFPNYNTIDITIIPYSERP